MKTRILIFSIISVFSLTSSCKKTEQLSLNNDGITIKYGSLSGECGGYCNYNMEIIQTDVTIDYSSWYREENPDMQVTGTLTDKQKLDLEKLVNKIDFNKLDTIYRKPGIIDNTTEWIEVSKSGRNYKIVVESMSNHPTELEDLLVELRNLKTSHENDKATPISMIRYGTVCGLCQDYNKIEMEIEQTKVIFSASSRNTEKYPQIQNQKSIIIDEWNKIVDLADSISLFNKPEPIHTTQPVCEDCVAEWVEIITTDSYFYGYGVVESFVCCFTWKRKITFDYDNRPVFMINLTDALRELRSKMN